MIELIHEPVFWSAIAAWFAFFSSLMIVLIQRRNLLESVRPELVLVEWDHLPIVQGTRGHEAIAFKAIKNVGRGVALNIILQCSHQESGLPTAVLPTKFVPILAVNEESAVNGEIVLWWQNVVGDDYSKTLALTIRIQCLDSRGLHHETRYELLAVGPMFPVGDITVAGAHELARGVALLHRSTISVPRWRTRLSQWFRDRKRQWARKHG